MVAEIFEIPAHSQIVPWVPGRLPHAHGESNFQMHGDVQDPPDLIPDRTVRQAADNLEFDA